MIELEDLDAFDAHLGDSNTLAGTACQGLDLRERTWKLVEADVRGAFFLGCQLEASALEHLNDEGACVFPAMSGLPFNPFRGALYSPDELYDGYVVGDAASYERTPDALAYHWHVDVASTGDVIATLAERIHDHAVDDAIRQLLEEVDTNRVVAIMGGHGLSRTDQTYRSVALLGRELTRAGFYVATGGGPGAMEAANLGGWMAQHPDEALGQALDVLAGAASFEPVGEWLDAAFAVRQRWPNHAGGLTSLGVPTWHYGHEPPNAFAGEIAKYFANSIREEGLLAVALGGVVFAPGSAGTIQEIFQDAAQNHYKSFGRVSPMVFLDTAYWTETKPVLAVLQQLAQGHDYAEVLTASDSVDEIVRFLRSANGFGSV